MVRVQTISPRPQFNNFSRDTVPLNVIPFRPIENRWRNNWTSAEQGTTEEAYTNTVQYCRSDAIAVATTSQLLKKSIAVVVSWPSTAAAGSCEDAGPNQPAAEALAEEAGLTGGRHKGGTADYFSSFMLIDFGCKPGNAAFRVQWFFRRKKIKVKIIFKVSASGTKFADFLA